MLRVPVGRAEPVPIAAAPVAAQSVLPNAPSGLGAYLALPGAVWADGDALCRAGREIR